jgi:hypothetical protein
MLELALALYQRIESPDAARVAEMLRDQAGLEE